FRDSILFFLSVCLHLRPAFPLFPYTTLFRSAAREHRHADEAGDQPDPAPAADFFAEHQEGNDTGEHHHRGVADRHYAGGGALRRDRKSTRLNSSHVKISYAVFCLKKKKNVGA